ncbi:MAG: Mrp/NBP35 family ATP-binding protein [Chloroflexota bacterium]|nr:Mrp/NBP35 family ATP-binding protein [Chloroflexota bacterium]
MFGRNKNNAPAVVDVNPGEVMAALGTVQEPELGGDLVTRKMIEDLKVEGGKVSFTVVLTTPACPLKNQIESEARAAVMSVPGVREVRVNFTSRVVPKFGGNHRQILPGVAHTIAVASGKGGVGKSTMSVGLAVALQQSGARVGLLDADIYGPNVPIMMGVETMASQQGERLIPAESHGVKIMSMAFFLTDSSPAVWRGPMVSKMIQELLTKVDWGELDYLVIDLPPGTGDASLTLAQTVPLTGAVVVTTPQDVALSDVVKGVEMFKKLNVPLIGMVENMSYFVCPHCRERTEIFGHGGELTAKRLDLPFLGEVPLHPAIREGGDIGMPLLVSAPDAPQSRAIRRVAEQAAARISVLTLKNRPASISNRTFIPLTPR